MADPKSKPADSAKESAAPHPGPGLMPTPAGYQFPSRKARREAELTGMIPIIVPKNAVPAPKAPDAGLTPGGSSPSPDPVPPGTVDGANGSSGFVADTLAAEAADAQETGTVPLSVTPTQAAPKPAAASTSADDVAGKSSAKTAAQSPMAAADSKPQKTVQSAIEPTAKGKPRGQGRGHEKSAAQADRDTGTGTGAKPAPRAKADSNGRTESDSKSPSELGSTTRNGGSVATDPSFAPSDTKHAPKQGLSTVLDKKDTAKTRSSTTVTTEKAQVADPLAAPVTSSGAEMDGDSGSDSTIAAPRPVAAVQITGLPVIPSPGGPIAALPAAATAVRVGRTPKAGRDLPAAIGVGLGLLVVVIGSMLFFPVAFVVVATIFACVGSWEVNRALAGKGIHVPVTPVLVGALAMPASAYFAGAEGLLFALVASAGATVLWRSLDATPGGVKSILAGVFTLTWIPFLLSFVFLMLREERGPTTGLTLDLGDINPGVVQVLIMLLLVVANDTFGYLVGVLFGKHPMAPKISPKKSWEGFAGSLGGATLVAIPATVFLLDQDWWVGLALAVGMVFAGTGGDFAESMVKRELGVKDMSNLLPGHGGVMDRLDSILFAAPVAYVIFTVVGSF